MFEWRRKALVREEESGERVLSAETRLLLFSTFFGLVCPSLDVACPSFTVLQQTHISILNVSEKLSEYEYAQTMKTLYLP